MKDVKELLYSNDHEWLSEEGGEAYIGISDFAQHKLGDIVFINLPEPGDELTAGDPLGDVESVKAVSDLVSPVSAKVLEVNEELLDAPEKLNEAPYEAWLVKVGEISDKSDLMGYEDYEKFIAE